MLAGGILRNAARLSRKVFAMGFSINDKGPPPRSWHLNHYAATELLSLVSRRYADDPLVMDWIDRATACQFLYFDSVFEESGPEGQRVLDALDEVADDIVTGKIVLADVPDNELALVQQKYRELTSLLHEVRAKYLAR